MPDNSQAAEVVRIRNPPPGTRLTTREVTVLKLMADGLTTKEIAASLGVTFKTVASHRTHILEKLNFHETVLAVRWAIRTGLIDARVFYSTMNKPGKIAGRHLELYESQQFTTHHLPSSFGHYGLASTGNYQIRSGALGYGGIIHTGCAYDNMGL
jgi:DNA-binding CsgD family transcriptional regulator